MTMTFREMAITVACDYCEAATGERCRTASGKPTESHVARCGAIGKVWLAGYDEGVRDAVEAPRWAERMVKFWDEEKAS